VSHYISVLAIYNQGSDGNLVCNGKAFPAVSLTKAMMDFKKDVLDKIQVANPIYIVSHDSFRFVGPTFVKAMLKAGFTKSQASQTKKV